MTELEIKYATDACLVKNLLSLRTSDLCQ